jgi:uncharacterized membrane protein YczE
VGARLLRLLFGLFLFGFGIGLLVQSGMGLPPWEVLHQGIARNTPLTIGQSGIGVGLLVLVLWIPLRERPGLGTIANALLVGLFIDLTIALVPGGEVWPIRGAQMLGGIVVVGIGSGFYIGAGLGPGPRDGLMTGLARRGRSLRLTRTMIEGAALAAGWLLGGTVGIGTLAFTLLIGPLVQVFLPRLDLGGRLPAT